MTALRYHKGDKPYDLTCDECIELCNDDISGF